MNDGQLDTAWHNDLIVDLKAEDERPNSLIKKSDDLVKFNIISKLAKYVSHFVFVIVL